MTLPFQLGPAGLPTAEMSGESLSRSATTGCPLLVPGLRRRALLRAAVGLGIAGAGGLFTRVHAAELKVGQPAPPLVLHTLDGRIIATPDLLGQVVVATFWATWCVPCREELPLLSAYAAQHAPQGLQVLGFSLDEPQNLPKVRTVAASLSFPVGLLGSPWVPGVRPHLAPARKLCHRPYRSPDRQWLERRFSRVDGAALAARGGSAASARRLMH